MVVYYLKDFLPDRGVPDYLIESNVMISIAPNCKVNQCGYRSNKRHNQCNNHPRLASLRSHASVSRL